MVYEVLYFDGDAIIPAYYLIGGVEGNSPEKALANNLVRVIQEVRKVFDLPADSITDAKIQETIYVARPDGLIPARRLVSLSLT